MESALQLNNFEALKNGKDILTVHELQEILRIGKNKTYSLLKNGIIPSVKIGIQYRIPKEAVINYLNSLQ